MRSSSSQELPALSELVSSLHNGRVARKDLRRRETFEELVYIIG